MVRDEWHFHLVRGDWKTIVGDMKDTLGRALIVQWVVQYSTLIQAVAADLRVKELRLSNWKTKFLSSNWVMKDKSWPCAEQKTATYIRLNHVPLPSPSDPTLESLLATWAVRRRWFP